MRILTIMLVAATGLGAGAQPKMRWHLNRYIAFQAAEKSGKPVMLIAYGQKGLIVSHGSC